MSQKARTSPCSRLAAVALVHVVAIHLAPLTAKLHKQKTRTIKVLGISWFFAAAIFLVHVAAEWQPAGWQISLKN
jgi:hypothetical protein